MMALRNLNKIIVYFSIVFNFVAVLATAVKDIQQNAFTVEDYVKTLRGRQLGYEFYDYIKNLAVANIDDRIEEEDRCLGDLTVIAQNIQNGSIWALRVIDSWGLVPAGLLYGNLIDLGNYDECVRVNKKIDTDYYIKGKYCPARIPIGKILPTDDRVSFSTAFCIPSSCSGNKMNELITSFFNQTLNIDIGTKMIYDYLCSVKQKEPLSGAAIATITIISIFTGLAILCTIVDYFYMYKYDTKLHSMLNVFSIRNNAQQAFRIIDYGNNPNVIPCLNGIRCLSLIWVIYGHVFSGFTPTMNAIDYYDWFQTPFSMLLSQAFFAVDSFFFLTAFLVTTMGLREMHRANGKLNIPLMYLYRYLRLAPFLGFAILVHLSMKYMGDGPLWKPLGYLIYETCETTWWSTMLFIQNYYEEGITLCLGQSWYLAVDMQLYICSPILIISFYKWGKKGVAGTLVLILLLWAWLFTTMMTHDEYAWFYKKFYLMVESFEKIYEATHMRTSPWLIGMIFGYYIHTTKGERVQLPIYGVLIGWIACFGLIATCLFSLYPKSQMSAAPLTTLEGALFLSLTRIAWPIALAWIVFACKNGYGGPIDSFLGHALWQPLVRISYSMFLFHFLIIRINAGRVRTSTYFSNYSMFLRFWQDFGFSILLGAIAHLLIEAPILGIVQLITPDKKKPKPSVVQSGKDDEVKN